MGFHGAPRCEICDCLIDRQETRFQMTKREPMSDVLLRLWWLCDACYEEMDSAVTAVRQARRKALVKA